MALTRVRFPLRRLQAVLLWLVLPTITDWRQVAPIRPLEAYGQIVVLHNPAMSPENVARDFVAARQSGATDFVLSLVDPDIVEKTQQLLRDVHADDKSSAFAESLKSAGETDPRAALLTMLFGPAPKADQVIEVVGRVEQGANAALVFLRIKQFISHFPEPVSRGELSVLALVHRPNGWFVRAPGGDADLKTLRDMVTEGLVARRDGSTVERVTVPDASPGSVTLVSIDPPANAVLTGTSSITAELEYAIDRFEPQRFRASARVAEIELNMSTMGTGAPYEQPVLAAARGHVRLVFPALAVWDDPKVKRPFEVSFCVDQLVGRLGGSITVACTKPVVYRASGRTAPASIGRLATVPKGEIVFNRAAAWSRQRPTAPSSDSPEAVAKMFLDAAVAGDIPRCETLLDPEIVGQFRDVVRKAIAEGSQLAAELSTSGYSAVLHIVISALRRPRAGVANDTVEIVGTLSESPAAALVAYRLTSSDAAHSARIPISTLNALRMIRQNGSWRVTTPNGQADATMMQTSMRLGLALGAEMEKLNPNPAGTHEAVPASGEEAAVRRAATEWRDAKIKHDASALDRLMTSDFLEMNQNGARVSRAQFLSLYRTTDLVFTGIDVESLAVEIAGNRARVTGVHTESVKYQGRDVGGRISFTEVYVNNSGRWQIEWSELKRSPKTP